MFRLKIQVKILCPIPWLKASEEESSRKKVQTISFPSIFLYFGEKYFGRRFGLQKLRFKVRTS